MSFLAHFRLVGEKLEEHVEEHLILLELEPWHIVNGGTELKDVVVLAWLWRHLQVLPEPVIPKIVTHRRQVALYDTAIPVELKEISQRELSVFIRIKLKDDEDSRVCQVTILSGTSLDEVGDLDVRHILAIFRTCFVADCVLIENLREDINGARVQIRLLVVQQGILRCVVVRPRENCESLALSEIHVFKSRPVLCVLDGDILA